MTIVVSSTAPTLETFNWSGLTEVTFNSFGGTPIPRTMALAPSLHWII